MNDRPSVQWFDFSPDDAAGELHAVADQLAAGGVIGLRFRDAVSSGTAKKQAAQAAEGVRCQLVARHGLPPAAYVEIDEESRGVPVAPFQRRRFLLPHQDGGHCSFLTPSRLDCSDVRAEDRVFSSGVYWRRPSHKMIQGFLVTNAGEPPGATYYYSAVALLRLAFERRYGSPAASISDLGQYALENIRRARALSNVHRSRYVTPGAFFGSPHPAHHVLPSGPRAESHFWPQQYAAIPELFDIARNCSCRACEGPGSKALCHAFEATLGLTWPEVRSRFEVTAVARRHELLLANNLTLFHAADSERSRTLVPVCIVTDRSDGTDYEHWLARQWRNSAAVALEVKQTHEA